MRTIRSILAFIASGMISMAQAQVNNSSAAATFVTNIQPDARTAAMGGASTAISTGIWSTYNNNASAVLDTARIGVGYSYVPWQRDARQSSYLSAVAGVFRFDSKNALTVGFRHFAPGRYEQWSDAGELIGEVTPREQAFELGYARKLFDEMSIGATVRLIHSDLKVGRAANAVSFDLSLLYRHAFHPVKGAWWSVGIVASNLGSRLSYDEQSYNLSSMVKGGAALYLPFSRSHELTVVADVIGTVTPSSASECNIATGVEYRFRRLLSVRGGYHGANPSKGTGDYFTLGGGLSYHAIDLSMAWLSACNKNNPLNNTFTFTVGVGLDLLFR